MTGTIKICDQCNKEQQWFFNRPHPPLNPSLPNDPWIQVTMDEVSEDLKPFDFCCDKCVRDFFDKETTNHQKGKWIHPSLRKNKHES